MTAPIVSAPAAAAELDEHVRGCDDCMLVAIRVLYKAHLGEAEQPPLCVDGDRLLHVLVRALAAQAD